MTDPKYRKPLEEHLKENPDLLKPGVHHVEVHHDDDCAIWSRGVCSCDAVIASGDAVDEKHEGGEG